MISVRLGNTIEITWRFKNAGTDEPFPVEGKNILLILRTKGQSFIVKDYTAEGNVITFQFKGKDQSEPGVYAAEVIFDPGTDDQFIHDERNVFQLVRHSWKRLPNCLMEALKRQRLIPK